MSMVAILLFSGPAMLSGQQIAIAEYPIPTGNVDPWHITAGPDGALWFTELNSNNIGRITTAGAISEYPVPTANSPYQIATGPDGALWFTEDFGNKIGRITTGGVITEYDIPTLNSQPEGITAGPDGALWFTEWNSGKIGRITTAGVITEYPTSPSGGPTSITTGPDGALWFTYNSGSKIGRITTAGLITEYPVPTANSNPEEITTGPDGALWFTEFEDTTQHGGKIGRITTAGVITEYTTTYPHPFGITAGPDDALWFTDRVSNDLSRITTAGLITEYPLPAVPGGPNFVTIGPDAALWFTDTDNTIGEVVFVTANLSVSPASGFFRSNLTFTGTAFAPNENVQIYARGVGSGVLASATADATGSFSAAALAPAWPFGPRIFIGMGQSSGKLGAANFSMRPRLILNPNAGAVGSTTTAYGIGFGSRETVEIDWMNPQTVLGTVTADVNGTFTGNAALTFTVPAGAPVGANKVTGKGQTTGATGGASFTVQ
jgi:virginiamycin B lyase